MEEAREVNMLAILTDSKPGISTLRKLDRGHTPPRSEIEAGVLEELCTRIDKDTCVAWVKAHKEVRGNEEADMLCKVASILGHESEGVVTPNGLRAWAKRERAEARGGVGEGILGWHRRAISAYAWCVMEKGPQRRWLHRIGKEKTPGCHCHQQQKQSGRHIVEECPELIALRREVEEEWWMCHLRLNRKKEKGDIGVEKEREKEEGEKLEKLEVSLVPFMIFFPNLEF